MIGFEIDHIGVAVQSLEESIRFYQRTLGMSIIGRETISSERVHAIMLSTGPASYIELLEATDDESAISRFIEKRGPGLHHIALRVGDLEAVADRLQAEGCRLLNKPQIGAGGHRYIFVHPQSTGGVLLELIQQ